MNDTVEIQERFFREYCGLVRSLSDVGSVDELLGRQDEIHRLSEIFSFIKIYSQEQVLFNSNMDLEISDNQDISLGNDFVESAVVYQETEQDFSSEQIESVADSNPANSEIQPNVKQSVDLNSDNVFNDNLNDENFPGNSEESAYERDFIDNDGFIDQQIINDVETQEQSDINVNEFKSESKTDEAPLKKTTDSFGIDFQADEVFTEDLNDENSEFSEDKFEEESSEDFLTKQNGSESITENYTISHTSEQALQETESQSEKQKRIKLAQIKNFQKNTPSLFDDVNETEERPVAKSNMPLEAMEAPKPRPDFRLDLNDRISFTKKLFGGSQLELNEAINTLNSFKTADEAREYLSEIYYDRNWKKCDDVAQRLWNLVENKFL